MPSDKIVRGPLTRAKVETEDAVAVLDPELEVRDGGKGGSDKAIRVILRNQFLLGCRPKVDAVDKKAAVYTKYGVKWLVTNNCKVKRTVEIVFTDPKGSPLKACTTEIDVPGNGGTGTIACDVADNTGLPKLYSYDIRSR